MKLKGKILALSLIPVITLGIVMFLVAADRIANGIYDEAYIGMQATTLAVRDIFEVREEQQEICDMLLGKLRALALEHGFLPLDDEGRIIYLLPSYGFEVIFYCPARGRGDELFNLVRAVYNELGEHIEDGHVGTIQDNTGNGEYFRVQLGMQDYLDKPARTRLMLAAYFRLLLLARKKGFVALMPPEEIRKRGFAGHTHRVADAVAAAMKRQKHGMA